MTRFCVENTIDQDLVDMQERKQEEIDGIMENGGTTNKK
jgi:SNF2 family DNA or RNA helicase